MCLKSEGQSYEGLARSGAPLHVPDLGHGWRCALAKACSQSSGAKDDWRDATGGPDGQLLTVHLGLREAPSPECLAEVERCPLPPSDQL